MEIEKNKHLPTGFATKLDQEVHPYLLITRILFQNRITLNL